MGNYKVVKQAINFELANFLFNYFLLKREAVAHMYENNWTYDTGLLGTFSESHHKGEKTMQKDHSSKSIFTFSLVSALTLNRSNIFLYS